MTCENALLMLLDADLAALVRDNSSPLGRHLAGCARCQAIVARLQADTSRLAAMTGARTELAAPRRHSGLRRRAIWLAPIPLAAAAVLAFVASSRVPAIVAPAAQTGAALTHAPAPAAPPTASVSASRPSRGTDAPDRRRPRAAAAPAPVDVAVGHRWTPTRIEVGGPFLAKSVAPLPVAFDADPSDGELTAADVATPGGRVVVLRPGNTNITVVWFY